MAIRPSSLHKDVRKFLTEVRQQKIEKRNIFWDLIAVCVNKTIKIVRCEVSFS